MSPHYDTTKASRKELEQYNKQTATQDNRISCFFESNPGEAFTPWEVMTIVFSPPMPPITSVRRSMSDLTKAGILTKTTHKKEVGYYGRRSYAWTLNEKYRETRELLVFADQEQVQEILEEIDDGLDHSLDEQYNKLQAESKRLGVGQPELVKLVSRPHSPAKVVEDQQIGLSGTGANIFESIPREVYIQQKTEPVKQAKTSPQGKLFDIAPMDPVQCSICGRHLTDPKSIRMGIGAVCLDKCRSNMPED